MSITLDPRDLYFSPYNYYGIYLSVYKYKKYNCMWTVVIQNVCKLMNKQMLKLCHLYKESCLNYLLVSC